MIMATTTRSNYRLVLCSLPSLASAQQSIPSTIVSSSSRLRFVSTHPSSFIVIPRTPTSSMNRMSMSTAPLNDFAPPEHEGNDVAQAMGMLAKADAVCFDVDSTVIDEEGIDVLAETLGNGPEVAAWTMKAMGGGVKFEDALAARLNIIQPSKSDIASCLAKHPLRLTPGIADLVKALHSRGTHVYLVSGGFRLMIEPVAQILGISNDRIYANTIIFNDKGEYAGFDASEPTSADGGKPRALGDIKTKYGYKTMIMVGDGATDAQAKPPADAFIGFGGVITRDAVREKACWFIRDFKAMTDIVADSVH